MNDEEAFEYWLESMRVRGDRPEGYERRAWQDACEWKQHEVDAYREAARTEAGFVNELQAENTFLKENINGTRMKQMNEEIEQLKVQNSKLRECVEWIGEMPEVGEASGYARQVLKELDEE
jgi:hypothetical protein